MALQEKDKKLLMLLGVVGVGFIIWYFFTNIKPQYDEMTETIKKERKEIENVYKQAEKLNEVNFEIDKMKLDLKKLQRYFPAESDQKTLELLQKMEALGEKLNISFSSLQFSGEMLYSDGLYKEIKMKLTPTEPLTYRIFVKWLDALDKYQNILDIKKITVVPAGEKKQLVKVVLEVSFYVFRKGTFDLGEKK